jgi:hypothetical protein
MDEEIVKLWGQMHQQFVVDLSSSTKSREPKDKSVATDVSTLDVVFDSIPRFNGRLAR